jgi:hypothetical protein
MKVPGYGGFWVINSSGSLSGGAVQHNAEYEIELDAITEDCLPSGNGGWVQGLPITLKFESATIKIYEDDSAYAEALGLTEGTVLNVWFKRGADDVYDLVKNTIVQHARYVNGQRKARCYEVRIEFGTFTRFVTAPTIS